MNNDLPLVSLILVVRNSEIYLENAVQSYLNQNYPLSRMELIIVDGMSDDKTLTKINQLKSNLLDKFFSVSILKNEKKILATGWNIAINHASGEFVCRIDVHSSIPIDYISSAVKTLSVNQSDVVGVGGVLINKSLSNFGQVACDFYSSKFGVGNSPFRIDRESGIVESDTAVFAVYKTSLFKTCGLFNEELGRNQDIEFHKRVSKSGLKLLTDYSLKCHYYVRSNISAFVKKAYNDGFWVVMSKSFYLRHLIPLFFVFFCLGQVFLASFFDAKWLLFITIYFLLAVIFGFKDGKKLFSKLTLPFLFLFYHLSYGCGSLVALLRKKV
ncbi:Glycosyltransferase [Moritella sp. JT01]|uniref:glycosyltransferase family 2 protein n=1 Tax=Moritella sp. JT01 TaxID=756698 RepID=UPI000791515B|nr:glycosyltransferase family 2 protein [Moritella sp. JT01]KXO13736.1 Glycosyltransferase [Moritella sp. JT01]